MARPDAQGFVTNSTGEINKDVLNSLMPQWGNLNAGGTEPDLAASLSIEGVEFICNTAGDDFGRRFQVRGGIWVELPASSGIDSLTAETPERDDSTSFADADNAGATRKALISSILRLTQAGDILSGVFSTARIPNLSASKITSGVLGLARGGTGQATARAAAAALLGTHSVQLVTSSGSPGSYTPSGAITVLAIVSTTGSIRITRGSDVIDVSHDPDEGSAGLVIDASDTVSVTSGYAILSLVS